MADESQDAPGGQPQDAPGGQQESQDAPGGQSPDKQPRVYDEAFVNDLKKQNHRFRQQARDAMSESERAIAEAEERGRTAATANYGKRLARAEFDSLAGRRNPKADTAAVLEFVDLARFVGEDGEPDTKAIKAAVERLVPASNGAPDFDGGPRGRTAATTDMNQVIRRAAGVA